MKAVNQKLTLVPQIFSAGQFTRAEAGALIAQGTRHIHSHPSTSADTLVSVTQGAIKNGNCPRYPWEITNPKQLEMKSSKCRAEVLQKILEGRPNPTKREMTDSINMVFEELATNAIYHSYQSNSGKDKYPRSQAATLSDKEKVTVWYQWEKNGLYLAMQDNGGTLKFEHVQDAFKRCYLGDKKDKIEGKEGGAGLGLYMVFEAVSHLKVQVTAGVSTVVSCWIQEKSRHVEESFSFNFFTGKEQP